MSYADAEEAINARVASVADELGIAAANIIRDNGPEPTSKPARWLRLRLSAERTLATMGNPRRWRWTGQLVVECYASAKQGAAALREVGDALAASLLTPTTTPAAVRFGRTALGQFTEQGGGARRDLTAAFSFDEEG